MKTTIIRLTELSDHLSKLGIKPNEQVTIRESDSAISIRIDKNTSYYHLIAKCGEHTQSYCNRHRNTEECKACTLIKKRTKRLYITKNGIEYKRCPVCGKYKPLSTDFGKRPSWCLECRKKYNQRYHKK